MDLLVFQSMWAMEGLPFEGAEWTLEEQVRRMAEAGFDGAEVDFDDLESSLRVTSLLKEHGLKWNATCFPKTVDDLRPIIEWIELCGAEHCHHINLQPNIRPSRALDCIPYILGWQSLADEAGIDLLFENHRDRMTTDLLFTLQLIDAVPSMKLTADLSHFLVAREFRIPLSDEDDALIQRILRRSWAYHGRVASREQIQLQLSFPHNQVWVEMFRRWWGQGFQLFRQSNPESATLTFTAELGPPEWYAMTGSDGAELSDRWAEALLLRDMARSLWAAEGN